jgi:hypothetical protein
VKARALKCAAAPTGLQGFACNVVSTACSCLVTPTRVVTSTSTATQEVISTSTTCGKSVSKLQDNTMLTVHLAKVCAAPTPDICSSKCVNLQSDNAKCGICGFGCDSSRECVSGTCKTNIGTLNDPKNCGSCGRDCGLDYLGVQNGCCAGVCTSLISQDNCGCKCIQTLHILLRYSIRNMFSVWEVMPTCLFSATEPDGIK